MSTEPINLDTVIANLRNHAEGGNGEQYAMLSPDAASVLVAEFDRRHAVEAELKFAHYVLNDDEALWRRMLPRLERWADERNRRMVRDHAVQAAEWRVRMRGMGLE